MDGFLDSFWAVRVSVPVCVVSLVVVMKAFAPLPLADADDDGKTTKESSANFVCVCVILSPKRNDCTVL